jgi:hypothetical protein
MILLTIYINLRAWLSLDSLLKWLAPIVLFLDHIWIIY